VLENQLRLHRAAARSLALPKDVAAAANPKSSTGRLDVFTRVIATGPRLRSHRGRLSWSLYAEISPKTFPVLVRELRLSQIDSARPSQLDTTSLRALHDRERLTTTPMPTSATASRSASIWRGSARTDWSAYRAKRHNR